MRWLLVGGWIFLQAQLLNRSGKDSTIYVSGQVYLPNYPILCCKDIWGLAVADFNGDDRNDVVVSCKGDGKLLFYFGDGKGHFPKSQPFPLVKDLRNPLAVDLDRDENSDIVIPSVTQNKLYMLRQVAPGKFEVAGTQNTGMMPLSPVAADLNNDGYPEVLLPCHMDNALYLYPNSRGKLLPPEIISVPKIRTVAVGDLNKDNRIDIVVGSEEDQLYIFYNDGSGKWGQPFRLPSKPSIWALHVADFNRDGRMDIVASTYLNQFLLIHLGKVGPERFTPPQTYTTAGYNMSLVVGDFNKDHKLDAATISLQDHCINIFLGEGDGKFSGPHCIPTGNRPNDLVVTDINEDQSSDFLTTSMDDGAINIHRNIPVNPPKPLEVRIYGRVLDAATGAPVQANVTLSDTVNDFYQATRFTGQPFDFSVPVGRRLLILKAQAPDYPPVYERISLPRKDKTPDSLIQKGIQKDLLLRKIEKLHVLGKVRDAKTGDFIANATVSVTSSLGEEIGTVQTDAKGNYRLEVPLGTNYRILAQALGYEPEGQVFSLGKENYPTGLRIDLSLTKEKPKQNCLEGIVYNEKTRQPIPNARIAIMDPLTGLARKIQADPKGKYRVCLSGPKALLEVIHKGYFPYRDSVFFSSSNEQGQTRARDLYLNPVEAEKAIVLKNIYFDYDKATLRPESMEELDRVVRFLRENPSLNVEIGGHTDSDGSDEYNLRLSQARAQAVVDYLVSRGLSPDKLRAKGYGESRPVVPNTTPENKQLNRRTELKIIGL
ncbi:MAG: FG-GAP-like repeat-containing protein [Bacteroidia bacterium]